MTGVLNLEPEESEFIEVDPTGRYGRYNEILGKGACKTVYRAFDEYEGIEVAWNQVKLFDFLQSPEDLERLYSEIHLLKTLKHKNIMKLNTSWVDTSKRNINFVTEMFTSGTLKQYRMKHKRVNIRAVKHWCRQILKGLVYLHSHEPPVIHRDLKCDNIFVNGNHGEVKIGDLGLAAIMRKSHAAHCVGTPEFMAPEVYKEEYNELVDIYSFGMCILEMVTFEYPYSECTSTAQIYQKVISGKKPDALFKVKDNEVREFIEKCLAPVSLRLSARDLLNDGFLQIDDYGNDPKLIDSQSELDDFGPLIRQPFLEHCTSDSSFLNGHSNSLDLESYNELGYQPLAREDTGIELFEHHDDDHPPDVDITIKGKRRDDGSIFLRLRITDKEGHVRNIYFPFDIELDTALSVATEMVAELDITDQDVISIADMIDGEISTLVPDWKPGLGIEETPRFSNMNMNLCQNCASNHTSIGLIMDFLSNNPGAYNSPFFQCPNGCNAAMHGRFEEITYQVDVPEHHDPETSETSHSDEEEHEKSCQPVSTKCKKSSETENPDELNDCENELQWELRWLKAKYLLELREAREISSKSSTPRSFQGDIISDERFSQSLHLNISEADGIRRILVQPESAESSDLEDFQKTSCPISRSVRARYCEVIEGSKNFLTDSLLPTTTLQRTTSLPVDAVYI